MGFARSVETLKEALGTRNAIGLAIGMTMERYDLDEERAFSFLYVSQTSNVKPGPLPKTGPGYSG
ncbi:MAG: ANTAR domain-containing protein [Nocardioidaceae bacterium]